MRKLPFIIGGAFIAAASAACYAFIPSVKNTVRMNVMKPEKYFAVIEEENFESTSKDVSKSYGQLLSALSGEANSRTKFDISLSQDLADDAGFGEPFEASFQLDYAKKKDKSSYALAAEINGVDIGEAQLAVNSEGIYGKYPFLLDQWLGIKTADVYESMGMDVPPSSLNPLYLAVVYPAILGYEARAKEFSHFSSGGYDDSYDDVDYGNVFSQTNEISDVFKKFSEIDLSKYLTEAEFNDMLKRYHGIIIDGFKKNVELDKKSEENAGGVSQTFSVATAEMNLNDAKDVVVNLLKELKKREVYNRDYQGFRLRPRR